MIFSFIPAIASLAISVFVNPAMAHPAPGKPAFNSPEHLALIKDNYLDVWNGNLTLLNETFAPVLQFHGDRFPSGNTSTLLGINTREDFLAFVERARAGWDQYEFKVHAWVGHENRIAVRWIMDGILGQNYSLAPTTLSPGDPVTYNGTDFLILDKCTGLVEEANIAQDLISFFHNLGDTEIPV